MSILLDTQALLWYELSDSRLSETASAATNGETGDVFISPASYWKIAIKISRGKYQLSEPFERFWAEMIFKSKLTVLAIEIRHAARVITLPKVHHDPFDRMIIAQALTEDLRVVSIDPMFDAYQVRRIW